MADPAAREVDGAMVDACIVGAGPAGLNAALLLGRCRRRVVVFDSGAPRNAASRGLHGFLTRDGTTPDMLRRIGREELARYRTVEVRDEAVVGAVRRDGSFEIHGASGFTLRARRMLLATGRVDVLPAKPGFKELYGRGVYHCPFCDGWENADQPVVAYGKDHDTFEVALGLLTWSRDVRLCSDGPAQLTPPQRERLMTHRIALDERPLAELQANGHGVLERIQFQDGSSLKCSALFFVTPCPQKSSLPENLGCDFDETGAVRCNGNAATNVPGLFVAGNVRCGLHLAITAAAEGAEAAVAINESLLKEDLAREREGTFCP